MVSWPNQTKRIPTNSKISESDLYDLMDHATLCFHNEIRATEDI